MNMLKMAIVTTLGTVLLAMGCGSTPETTGGGGHAGSGGTATASSTGGESSTSGSGPGPDIVLGSDCAPLANSKDNRAFVLPIFHDAIAGLDPATTEEGALAALRSPVDGTTGKYAATAYTYFVFSNEGDPAQYAYCGRVDHKAVFYVVSKTGTPNPHPASVFEADVPESTLNWQNDSTYAGKVAQVDIAINPPIEFDAETESVIGGPEYAIVNTTTRLCPTACKDGPDLNSFFSKLKSDFTVAPCPAEACDLNLMKDSPTPAEAKQNGTDVYRWIGHLTVHKL